MLDLITCEECIKEDVCPHKTEYKETIKQNSKDSNSPIYVMVGCRSAFKSTNTRELTRRG